MASPTTDYDPRYLAGVLFFNARDFFEAHEVWEDLWHQTTGPERRFYQGLIQAAVALFHFGNANIRGAVRLFGSSRNYMQPFWPKHRGLDLARFWQEMEQCFREVLSTSESPQVRPEPEAIPTIELDPAPGQWPDPEQFLPEDENGQA